MYDHSYSMLGLDNLLESDLSSYELFHSLPREMQQRIARRDPKSFEELCGYAARLRAENKREMHQ